MKDLLDANRELLLKNMVPEEGLLNNLLCFKLISERAVREIKDSEDIADRNLKILNSLSFHTEQQWEKFCECLLNSGHTYLAEMIIIRAPHDRCSSIVSILKTSPKMIEAYQSLSPNEKQEIGQTLANQIYGSMTQLLWAKMAEEKVRFIQSNLNQAQEVWSLNEKIKDRDEGVYKLKKALTEAHEEIAMKNEKISALKEEISSNKSQWKREIQLHLKHNSANESSLRRYEDRWRESEKILADMIIRMQKVIPRTSRIFSEKSITLVHKVNDLLRAVLESFESFPPDPCRSFVLQDRRLDPLEDERKKGPSEVAKLLKISKPMDETTTQQKFYPSTSLEKFSRGIQTKLHTSVTQGSQTKEFYVDKTKSKTARKHKMTQYSVALLSKASQTVSQASIPNGGYRSLKTPLQVSCQENREEFMAQSPSTSFPAENRHTSSPSESSIQLRACHNGSHHHPTMRLVLNPFQSKVDCINRKAHDNVTDCVQNESNTDEWIVNGSKTRQLEAGSTYKFNNTSNYPFQTDMTKYGRVDNCKNDTKYLFPLPSLDGRSLRVVPLVDQPLNFVYKQRNSHQETVYADIAPPEKIADALGLIIKDATKSNRRTTGLQPVPLMDSFPQLSFRPQNRQVSIPSKKILADEFSETVVHSNLPLPSSTPKK